MCAPKGGDRSESSGKLLGGGGTTETCLATVLPRLIEGDFVVLDALRLAATRAGRQRLNAVLAALLAYSRILQGPKLLA